MKKTVPVLRSFDETKAKEFYLEFLGFTLEFEHRFGDNFPLYMGVSRDEVVLHLSEHYGDASPGAHIRIETLDVRAIWQELKTKDYRHSKPGEPMPQPWGSLEISISDPFSNKLVFWQAEG